MVAVHSTTAKTKTQTKRRGPRGASARAVSEQIAAIDGTELFQDEIIELAVFDILSLYDDPERASLKDTPKRVAKMYEELLTRKKFAFTTFDAEGADQMIVERDIAFYTLCEHHLLPFYGTATVAYIPKDRIAGLSKLARAVEYFAHALQTQERMTNQIADFMVDNLDPVGVGVVLTGTHLCMEMRGVQKPGTKTITSALRGAIYDDASARAEFLQLAYSK